MARTQNAQRKPDWELLRIATDLDRVLISFDEFKGETGAKIAARLLGQGGRIVQILHGPEQPPEKALGRFMFHLPEWLPWLDGRNGIVTLGDLKRDIEKRTPNQYSQTISHSLRPQFKEYLASVRAEQSKPRAKPQRKQPQRASKPLSGMG